MKVTFRHLTLALTALLLVPLASCGKDKPTPTPPDPQPAKREDVIGKVHLVTVINFDKEGKIDSRQTLTLDKQLRFSRTLSESFKNEKFTPSSTPNIPTTTLATSSKGKAVKLGSTGTTRGINIRMGSSSSSRIFLAQRGLPSQSLSTPMALTARRSLGSIYTLIIRRMALTTSPTATRAR